MEKHAVGRGGKNGGRPWFGGLAKFNADIGCLLIADAKVMVVKPNVAKLAPIVFLVF